jgi:glycosyltransferase involved in cell wall biosynthesis
LRVSIIIPTYNNGDIIFETLSEITIKMNSLEYLFEIIVVSDGSSDNTISEVMKAKNQFSEIRLIHYSMNSGKGAAVTVGFAHALGEYVGFLDADNSTNLDSWIDMLNLAVHQKCDCIIGSRYKEYVNIKQPYIRKLSGYTFNRIVNSLFHLGAKDTQCGAKVFSRKSLDIILKHASLRGFGFDVDYLNLMKENSIKIIEHQISWTHHGDFGTWNNMLTIINIGSSMLSEIISLKSKKTNCIDWREIINN